MQFAQTLNFTSTLTSSRNHMPVNFPRLEPQRQGQNSAAPPLRRDTYLTARSCWQTNTYPPDSHLIVSLANVDKMRFDVAIVVAGACSAFAIPHAIRERSIVTEIKDSYDFIIVGGTCRTRN